MDVVVGNTRIRLDPNELLGAGGEGSVYKARVNGTDVALKVYHQPTAKRGKKLQDMIASGWKLPTNKIALPLDVVYDAQGSNIVGLTMPFLGAGFEELTSLSNKKYRASFLITTRDVAKIFIDGAATLKLIHANNLCVGDFNDLNGLFRGYEMLFIDADAWQYQAYPCPVATEQFLVPELYGIDLSLKPVFKPEYDWYSYAVMLFKSLLLVHPYGGIHKGYKQLTARAQKRVTVFDSGVTYPQIAIAPDLLDDTLMHVFEEFFSKGKYGVFPVDKLEAYANSLVDCKKCGTWYPSSRQACPVCSEKTLMIVMQPTTSTKGVTVSDFITTNGTIIFSRLYGSKLYVIANEGGKSVLYVKNGSKATVIRKELFTEIPGAKFELLESDVLIVAQPNKSEQLLLVDVSGSTISPITKTETNMFAGNRRSMFRASSQYMFRVAAGALFYSEVVVGGRLTERTLRSVMNNQTWFAVKTESLKPTAFGFFQIINQQVFWLVWEGLQYDNLAVSAMEIGESLIDISVKFSSQGLLVRRLTQFQGVEYLRTEIIDSVGKTTYSSPRVKREDHLNVSLHGQAYSGGKLLHSTDDGIVQENVETGQFKTFEATKGHVGEGDSVLRYQDGLLVIKDSKVSYLILG